MNKILHVGNLPPSLQVFFNSFNRESAPVNIYECESHTELVNLAKDGECELMCNLDPRTQRGYLVGFEAEEKIDFLLAVEKVTLNIYFTEVTNELFKEYDTMLKKHRAEQQEEMYAREERKVNKGKLTNDQQPV